MPTLEQLQNFGRATALYVWEEELARIVGTGRTTENIGKGDRRSYDQSRLMPSNLLANIHGAAVEIGVSRLIGAYCYAAVWPKSQHRRYGSTLPDALRTSTEVEIKWRRTAMKMPIDRKDVEADRLVLWAESKLASTYECDCSPLCQIDEIRPSTRVRLLGGGYARSLWEVGMTYNDDQNRVAVPTSALLTCEELGLGAAGWTG